jgi:hypothetical protein
MSEQPTTPTILNTPTQRENSSLVYFDGGNICMTGGISTLLYTFLTFFSLMCIIVANQITTSREKESARLSSEYERVEKL